ncbi:hypothetical protein BHE74_00053078, partial [Ensete ventricosum]
GVRQKKIETHQKIIGGSRKACREFAEGIEKLVGNTPGDHRKKTKRLIARMPEAIGLAGLVNHPYPGVRAADPPKWAGEPPVPGFSEYRFDLHPKKISSGRRCASRRKDLRRRPERNYNSYDTGLSCLNLSFYLRLESFDEGS